MDILDKFIEYLDKVTPAAVYLTKNTKRYNEAKEAIQEIADLVWGVDENAEIEVKPDELIGTSIEMTIRTCIFIVDETDKFCKALKKADAIDVVALEDGRVSIGISFNEGFVLIPPPDSKLNNDDL